MSAGSPGGIIATDREGITMSVISPAKAAAAVQEYVAGTFNSSTHPLVVSALTALTTALVTGQAVDASGIIGEIATAHAAETSALTTAQQAVTAHSGHISDLSKAAELLSTASA